MELKKELNVFSFGGGTQSVWVAYLQAMGHLKKNFDYYVFANVGEHAENPLTLQYIEDFVKPFFEKHNMNYVEVKKTTRSGDIVDLYDYTIDETKKGVQIPVRMKGKGFTQRKCTHDWKIVPVHRWIKNHIKQNSHLYADDVIVNLGIGFSTDELRRRKGRIEGLNYGKGATKTKFLKQFVYPLLDDYPMSREEIIKAFFDNNIPLAPRSACFFCPFHDRQMWHELREKQPDLFERAVEMEKVIQRKLERYNMQNSYLHRDAIPLSTIAPEIKAGDIYMDTDEVCQTGYCGV